MQSSEIDLHNHPHLRFLQFNLRLETENIRESQADVIHWFNSTCGSVTSKSLVVEVDGIPEDLEVCNRIQNMLSDLIRRLGW